MVDTNIGPDLVRPYRILSPKMAFCNVRVNKLTYFSTLLSLVSFIKKKKMKQIINQFFVILTYDNRALKIIKTYLKPASFLNLSCPD